MAPGAFNWSPNGPGLGDTKTFFRGFSDGQYTMTFDGIPFNDTNDPTHHSWAFFPSQFIGGAVFDRSPGSAATIGPSNFGGSIDLFSHARGRRRRSTARSSDGSFHTRLFDVELRFRRVRGRRQVAAAAGGARHAVGRLPNLQLPEAPRYRRQVPGTRCRTRRPLTVFGSYIDFHSNTPNQKGPTRAQAAQRRQLPADRDPPSRPTTATTSIASPATSRTSASSRDLGRGWTIDDKVYTYAYHNQQNYNSTTKISSTSAVDKLNAYRKVGPSCRSRMSRPGHLADRAVVDTRQIEPPPDALRSPDLGGRGRAELSRDVQHDDPSAVRRVRVRLRPAARDAGGEAGPPTGRTSFSTRTTAGRSAT